MENVCVSYLLLESVLLHECLFVFGSVNKGVSFNVFCILGEITE